MYFEILVMTPQGKQNIIKVIKDYGRKLFGYIRPRVDNDEDAEDILQDVWVRLTRVIDTEPIEQLSAWLFKVARNRIIDNYRKHKPEPFIEWYDEDDEDVLSWAEMLDSEDPDPVTLMLRETFWQELFAALDELPDEQREAFIMNELEDLTFEEIAKRTGENVKTLISRKRYAVQYLRERLRIMYDEIINQ